ncbi:MAG: cytochrome c3 family protein [Desulfarculaceae bacterium]|nr:cytochrome c3 family protein [Desulfarculaceae bacterium]MCF8072679.1 cytochrome c3 family protein [Desulfarculaceae bacterium]MCF8102558.1 cytochrome c3 family protein [Desulfarculaceae bacterium]MCF8116467.1 cytochrome c3 family protein [Desulfarculaceae bacterium]
MALSTKHRCRAAGIILALLAALVLAGGAGASVPPGMESSWYLDLGRYQAGAHGKLACAECHAKQELALKPGSKTAHPDTKDPKYLMTPALRGYDYAQCQRCHKSAYARYHLGKHAEALKKGTKTKQTGSLSPVCGDCHQVHYDPARLDRVELGRRQTLVCGACHPAQAATYLTDYHGQAGDKLGWDKAAFCSDCHGAHEVKSLKSPELTAGVCWRCHPGSNPRFAAYVVHPTLVDLTKEDAAKRRSLYLIYTVSAILGVLAVCVVGFFYGHTFLWMLREIQHKLRKH